MKQDILKFIDTLKTDESLQEKLKSEAEKYEGEQTPKAVFQNLICPLAEETGCHFTWEEYKEFMTNEAGEAKELNLDEMEQVGGGETEGAGALFCSIFGIGVGGGSIDSKPKSRSCGCLVVGMGIGALACAGEGVGA